MDWQVRPGISGALLRSGPAAVDSAEAASVEAEEAASVEACVCTSAAAVAAAVVSEPDVLLEPPQPARADAVMQHASIRAAAFLIALNFILLIISLCFFSIKSGPCKNRDRIELRDHYT